MWSFYLCFSFPLLIFFSSSFVIKYMKVILMRGKLGSCETIFMWILKHMFKYELWWILCVQALHPVHFGIPIKSLGCRLWASSSLLWYQTKENNSHAYFPFILCKNTFKIGAIFPSLYLPLSNCFKIGAIFPFLWYFIITLDYDVT